MDSKKCLMGVTGLFHTNGGIAAVNRSTLKALCDEGYRVDLYSLIETDNSVDGRYADPRQVNVDVSKGSKVVFVRKLWWAALHGKYDLVLVDHINLAASLAPLSAVGLLRYAVWLFGAELFPPRPDTEGKLGLRRAWKRLAISPYTRESLRAQFPEMEAAVCDLALDPVRHNDLMQTDVPARRDLKLKSLDGRQYLLGPQLILHVGRISGRGRDKGQKVLLRAFPQVFAQFPEAQLALVGDGDGLEELQQIGRNLPQAAHSRIFIPGYVEDDLLNRLYNNCYLFAMPSLGEGFGLVYLEAMSRKKPCLGARADATPYIVRDGQTGLLVDDPESADEVAVRLMWLLAHTSEAEHMGNAGRELVEQHYLFPDFKARLFKALTG
jgi:glycosyltransferase involved in cell wall biosynthesis